MFSDSKISIFDDTDELGVQAFREDAQYLFMQNALSVTLIQKNRLQNEELLQGSIGGVDINVFSDNEIDIMINIASQNSKKTEMNKEGYTSSGVVEYNAFCKYDVDIQNEDIIKFKTSYNNGITKGDRFRVVFKDFGEYQGQFAFKNFGLIRL